MTRVRRTIVVERDRSDVFALLADFPRSTEIFAGVTRWEARGPLRRGVGDRYRAVFRVGSIEVGGSVRIDEHDDGRRIGWVSETGFEHRGRWTCRRTRHGTRVALEMEFSLKGPAGWLAERLAGRILDRNLRATLLALKHQMEFERNRHPA